MAFQPGQSGNPNGRPKGTYTGRRMALRVLDELLEEPAIQEDIEAALRASLNKNPIAFFKSIIMPLLPAESKIDLHHSAGQIKWKSLLEAQPTVPADSGAVTDDPQAKEPQ